MKKLDDVTGELVDAALGIHRKLGPGLLESVYEAVLARELGRRVPPSASPRQPNPEPAMTQPDGEGLLRYRLA